MDKKILIVEDDLSSQALAKEVLKNFGTITIADSVASAQLACQGQYYDIIILDLHLPDKSGIEFCSEIRSNENFRSSTIYIASADEDISKKVSAFSIGADDYIVKPYSPLELRARIERTLKKQNQDDQYIEAKTGIKLNRLTYKAFIPQGNDYLDVHLTPHEFKLLLLLIKNPNRIYSRNQLIDTIWGQQVYINDRTIDTHMSMLRKKLKTFSKSLQSVRGEGYKWDSDHINMTTPKKIAA